MIYVLKSDDPNLINGLANGIGLFGASLGGLFSAKII